MVQKEFTIIDQIWYFGIIRQLNEISFIQGVFTRISWQLLSITTTIVRDSGQTICLGCLWVSNLVILPRIWYANTTENGSFLHCILYTEYTVYGV